MSWISSLSDDRRARIDAVLDRRGAAHLRYAGGDRDFAAFLLVADSTAARKLGVSIFDLADYLWRDAHDGDLTPTEALREALDGDDLAQILGVQDALDE